MLSSRPHLLALLLTLALSACRREEAPPQREAAGEASAPLMLARGLRLEPAPTDGEIVPLVASRKKASEAVGRRVLVYVGATWCEPCRRFHDAAERGELDGELADVDVIVFDLDRDRARLSRAGYVSEYIPLFAAPRDDGRPSGRQIEGGTKGDGAVKQLVERLKTLLRP